MKGGQILSYLPRCIFGQMADALPAPAVFIKLVGVQQPLNPPMGGLMALYTGLRAPEVFGRVLSQSGAFAMGERESVVFDLARHGPVPPLSIWLNAGRYEWLLDCNRRMHELLVKKGYDVVYGEYNSGHNYPSWRDHVGKGLETLFGG